MLTYRSPLVWETRTPVPPLLPVTLEPGSRRSVPLPEKDSPPETETLRVSWMLLLPVAVRPPVSAREEKVS